MQTILQIPGFTDSAFTHVLAGLGAGFFAVCIGSPIDVVSVLYPLHSTPLQFWQTSEHWASINLALSSLHIAITSSFL
jgi:hypothetical protein